MNGIAIVAAAAALLGLAGCNRAATTANTSANAAAGNSAAPKPADGTAANQTATQTADAGKLNSGGGAIRSRIRKRRWPSPPGRTGSSPSSIK